MKRKIGPARLREYAGWYLLMLIPIVGTLLFNLIPFIMTVTDSFRNVNGAFIGAVNYNILFKDDEFRKSVVNTLYMGVLGVTINIPIAFVLANMLNNVTRLKNFYKVVFLLPMIMSMVTVAILFKFIFSADPASIANFVLGALGIAPKAFLNDAASARETLVAMAIWKGAGYNVILFFAGLQTVPAELYEAARIDGANEWHQWRHITVPCMKNTFIFVYITSCISVLKRFADVYAVSGEYGNPAGALFTMMLYIFRKSFSTLFSKDTGVAAAASVILFLLILAITVVNYLFTEARDENSVPRRRRVLKGDSK